MYKTLVHIVSKYLQCSCIANVLSAVIQAKCNNYHVISQWTGQNTNSKQTVQAVYNHWTGLVDWTGGMDYWTRSSVVFFLFHQILVNQLLFVI